MSETIREASQSTQPCVLHKTHSPITVINELHHPFPQAWQKAIWGEIRDNTTVSVCATGHNSVHFAINFFEKNATYPSWCIGATRDLVEQAFILRELARSA